MVNGFQPISAHVVAFYFITDMAIASHHTVVHTGSQSQSR